MSEDAQGPPTNAGVLLPVVAPTPTPEGQPAGPGEAAEDGTAAFFERLLESMGIKPDQAKQYAAGLFAEQYDLLLFGELTAEELKADFGFAKGDIKRFESWKRAGARGGASVRVPVSSSSEGGVSPREGEGPSEGPTPHSARWGTVLQSEGPDRRVALQGVLDGWHKGRWVIEERELGRGAGGVVFQSSDARLGRIAVKFACSDDPRTLEREAALMQRVAHDRICRLHEHHDHMSSAGRLFGMMLELLEMGSLSERIRGNTSGRLREFEVVQMSFDVLAALQFMHEQNVIHRDIKPANIMLTEVDGRTIFKLIDLSIAAVEAEARESVSQTLATGTTSLKGLAGTPHYMSPEQFDSDEAVSSQTDMWSLGVVMFECLSGVLPFAAAEHDRNRVAYAIVNKPAPELSDMVQEVGAISEGMIAFVRRALQKERARRFGTATQMKEALDEMLTMSGDEKFGLFISYRVWCDKLFADDLYNATSKCQLRSGREHRIKVYLDKVRIVDGQRFDVNFTKGLANSTVFSPLVSANCLKNFVELGQKDMEDFVLAEWIMALELQKQGIVKAILPIVMGEQSTVDGKYSQSFFESVRDGRVCWPASEGFHAAGSGTIPDVVSAKSVAKARDFLGMLDPPIQLSEELTVKAVVDRILTFQAALLHFENDAIDNAAAGWQQVKVGGSHGGNIQPLARKHVAQTCAQRIAKIVNECDQLVSLESELEEPKPEPEHESEPEPELESRLRERLYSSNPQLQAERDLNDDALRQEMQALDRRQADLDVRMADHEQWDYVQRTVRGSSFGATSAASSAVRSHRERAESTMEAIVGLDSAPEDDTLRQEMQALDRRRAELDVRMADQAETAAQLQRTVMAFSRIRTDDRAAQRDLNDDALRQEMQALDRRQADLDVWMADHEHESEPEPELESRLRERLYSSNPQLQAERDLNDDALRQEMQALDRRQADLGVRM
eukprot:COSAG02_NODE_3140_length_7296_cov_180.632347_1_plen_957_part_10